MDPFLRKGSVALVTGGASGLGLATANRLAGKGVQVYVLDLERSIKNVGSNEFGNLIQFRTGDVTSEKDISTLVQEIREKHNRLDLLVNCAGILLVRPLYDFKKDKPQPLEEFAKVFNVNVMGTINAIRLCVPVMAKNEPNADGQRAVIINVSSCVRKDGCAGIVAYSGSKAAIMGMTMPLAREFGPVGIRVVTIAPGPMETPMLGGEYQSIGEACPSLNILPKRLGTPTEFASLVEFLAEHPLMTGATVAMDNGFVNPVSLLG